MSDTFSMRIGDRKFFANSTNKALGVVIDTPGGVRLRFNVAPGQTYCLEANKPVDGAEYSVTYTDPFDDLIGSPK